MGYTTSEYYLDRLAQDVHQIAKEHGFWDDDIDFDKVLAKLSLIHSEVTETLEAVRKNKGAEKITEEMADVIIRTLDLWAAMRPVFKLPSLSRTLSDKMEHNRNRPALHGHVGG